jgi:DNA-binding CsgD family transcriptional regulator
MNSESPYIRDLLSTVDLEAKPLRLFVTGSGASARPQLLAAVHRRLIGREAAVVTGDFATADRGPNTVVLIDNALDLDAGERAVVLEMLRRTNICAVVATDMVDPRLAEAAADFSTTGSVLHLDRLRCSDIQALAHGYGHSLTPDEAGNLECLSEGHFGALDAALRSPVLELHTVGDELRAYFARAVGALDARQREILYISTIVQNLAPDELDFDSPTDAFDRAVGTGLFAAQSPAIVESLAHPLGIGPERAALDRILGRRIEAGVLDIDTAVRLFDAGVRHPALAHYLYDAAQRATPAAAADLYRRAAVIESPSAETMLHHAECAASSGDLDTAVSLTDSILHDQNVQDAELAVAVRISAAVSAVCGQITSGADLYAWLGPARADAESAFGAILLVASGRIDDAGAMLAGVGGAPSPGNTGTGLLARGLMQSMTGPPPIALNTMSRALTLPRSPGTSRFQADSPAGIVATALMHTGAHDRAHDVLAKATATQDRSSHLWARHQILAAWAALLAGTENPVAAIPESAITDSLGQRDTLFLRALEVGVARRFGDLADVRRTWSRASGTLFECSVNLFDLLPICELWLAAVRLSDTEHVDHLIDEAQNLLRQLGDPPLWSSLFHWYGVQAAILGQSPADLLPHARALSESAKVHSYSAGLAEAGRQWLLVLQGTVSSDEIESAARTLDRIGHSWDAARLAGEAALRAPDTKSATTLLQLARSFRVNTPEPGSSREDAQTVPDSPLTEREHEIAELVVLGLTYREVGERLYISAKTVEHHVARIKRKVGAQSRSELLVVLRSLTTPNRQ